MTGEYVVYEEMKKSAEAAGIPVVSAIRDDSKTMPELLEKINSKKDLEGVVLTFDSGLMYKVKTAWFVNKQGGNSDLLCQVRTHVIMELINVIGKRSVELGAFPKNRRC